MYNYLVKNGLISQNQSGFRPGDSSIYQLLSLTANIYDSFGNYDETRAIFLDISKAFDRVWTGVDTGVPQGSVLGPLLFLVYINDLTVNISSNMKLFADDSSLFARVADVTDTHEKLKENIQKITEWAYQWKMVFNPDLTKTSCRSHFVC